MSRFARTVPVVVLSLVLIGSAASFTAAAPQASGQGPFTIEQVLSPAYPVELTAARKAERIAWIAYERGMRNVYTAAGPDFEPMMLTDVTTDDGNDMTDIRLSDNGAVAVFVRGHTPNREGWIANPTSAADGAERAIWGVRTSGGPAWRIAEGAAPALSPNGRWVLFARDGQIHRAPVDPNLAAARSDDEDTRLFTAFGDNGNPVWSPDGSTVAFVSRRDTHSLIGIYDIDRREVSYLAPSVDYDSNPAFSPDGSRIAYVRRPGQTFAQQVGGGGGGRGGGFRGGNRGGGEAPDGLHRAAFEGGHILSFWVADVASGQGHEFWRGQPNDNSYSPRSFEWADDHIVFGAEPGNWRHSYSVPVPPAMNEEPGKYGRFYSVSGASGASDATPVDLTPGEGIAEFTSVSPDGRYLFYATNVGDIDRRHLWRTPTGGGDPVQVTSGSEIETYPAALASGGVATLTAAYDRPLSVAVVEEDGSDARVIFPELTDEFPSQYHVVPQNVTLTAADGVEFHNQLFLPPDIRPGERRPAMLFTHGGPIRQMLLGYHYMHFYHMAYAINQYFASQGYVVISVNYRSGIGYGREFRNAPDTGGRGNSEYQDVLAAGEYLRDRPDVDPERIGLWGLSYGGILTAQGLARNSDIFSAGFDLAGVHLRGNSIDEGDVSYDSSAIGAIDGWTSPVLLLHGDDDRNVPFGQTVGLVQLLRAKGVYYELIVYPDDVHDSLLFSRWLTAFNAGDDFFNRFIVNKQSTPPAGGSR
ncbi:MAG: prolyl oligopeptidase family serine peptidase [Acidobacteriota bacterium]|jgi:dipeptidyl aminopeptidase/acylaminoacyl peptidase